MSTAIESIQTIGPVFVAIWALTIGLTILRPQKFFNSFLLLFALVVSVVFAASLFEGEVAAYIMLGGFLLVMLALMLVPVLLVINGIQMIRRESLSISHLLSLGLGIVVGIGELAATVYVLGLSDAIGLEDFSGWFLFVAFTVFYFSFLVLAFVIYSLFIQVMPHRMNFDYVIIHGCGLLGGERLTKLLQNRVDKAIEIYRRCEVKPIIIPSGGQGADEKVSEARAMADYLVSRGIPKDHILLEDRSTTTMENLTNSKAIIDAREGGKKTALVSSNYHVFRCLRYARKAKLRCSGIGAHVAPYYWPSALIREFIAVAASRSFLVMTLIGYLLFVAPLLHSLLG